MKRASLITALVLGMAAAIPATASAAPVTNDGSFTIICKAGGGMQALFYKNTANEMAVSIRFKKGQNPGKPNAGECTWIDRPINSAEPDQLSVKMDNGNFQVLCGQQGCHLKSAPGVAANLVNKIKFGATFTVRGFNKGNGFFQVTSVN